MTGHLLNFLFATSGVVALLYVLYLYLKQHPNLTMGGMPQMGQLNRHQLKIESVLNLEPRKRLYVVRYQDQRFMMSTTLDKTELVTALPGVTEEELQAEAAALEALKAQQQSTGASMPIGPQSTFMERFQYSLRMVILDRFTGLGGK